MSPQPRHQVFIQNFLSRYTSQSGTWSKSYIWYVVWRSLYYGQPLLICLHPATMATTVHPGYTPKVQYILWWQAFSFVLLNISHIWRYIDDFPSLSVLRCKLNTVLPLTLAQVFYCCVLGFSPENRHYWRTFFPYCSPVTQLQRYGSTCFTWGYTRGLVQNRPRHAWSH